MLEQRCLLSSDPLTLTAVQLLGPYAAEGTTYTFQKIGSDGTSAVHKITSGGLTSTNTLAIDDKITVTTPPSTPGGAPTTQTGEITTNDALLDDGTFAIYGSHATVGGGGSADTTNDPYEMGLPPVLVAGQSSIFTYTDTTVHHIPNQADSTDKTLVTDEVSLVPGMISVTVPKGTYSCYEIDTKNTSRDPSTPNSGTPDVTQDFYAPGVGLIRDHLVGENPSEDLMLTDFVNAADTLTFTSSGSETAVGENIKPPVVVKIYDKDGNLDTTGKSSKAKVTLSITGGGTLNGTLTVTAVGGVATFSDLSISTAGTYTLTASAPATISEGPSGAITISSGPPAELNPTLPRLNVPTSAVGGSKVNINGSVTVTNSTASTVTGNATVTAMLVGPNGATPAVARLNGNFIASPADTVSLQIGKPFKQHVSIKPTKTAKLSFHLTSLPNVPTAGSYALEFLVTSPNGGTATVIGPSITVGPAVITLSETISALKIPSTITIGQKLKAASIKLIVKNSGNVQAKGKTVFSVSASTTAGVAGTLITTSSQVLNTLPGKTKPVTINIKSLPALAAGSYFIVIQAKDSLGGTSIVSSSTPVTVTA